MEKIVNVECDVRRLGLLDFIATYPGLQIWDPAGSPFSDNKLVSILRNQDSAFLIPALGSNTLYKVSNKAQGKEFLILLDLMDTTRLFALRPGKDRPEKRPYQKGFLKDVYPNREKVVTFFSDHHLAYHFPFATKDTSLTEGDSVNFYAGYGGHNSKTKKALLNMQSGILKNMNSDGYCLIETAAASDVSKIRVTTEVLIHKKLVVPTAHLIPYLT